MMYANTCLHLQEGLLGLVQVGFLICIKGPMIGTDTLTTPPLPAI
jgi:hypothetical protein